MEPLDPEVRRLAETGRFVDAVRLLRRTQQVSLEEAWDTVERLTPAFSNRNIQQAPPAGFITSEIDDLLRAGQPIQAIKRLRETTSLSLRDAKDQIDRRAAELGVPTTRCRCFIATAAWGDEDAAEVAALRRFRDRVLRRSHMGRVLTRWYYRLSPPVAEWIACRPTARAFLRMIIGVFVILARGVDVIGRE